MKNYAYSFSKFGFAMLILFVANAARVVAQEVSSAGEVKAALRFIDIEKPTKAIESLKTLVNKYPTDATVFYALGYAYIKKGELDQASAEFDKGIKLNDKEPINYVGKGYVSLLKNNQADSKLNFDKAQALAKKNAAVLNGIAEAYLSNKQLAGGALDLLLKSKSINAKDPATLILLGDAYLQANDGGKSVSSYEDAALADPKNGKPHYKIGTVYNRSKNTTAAISAFEKAISVDPEYAPAFRELGEIYYGKSEGEKAVKAQESYLSIIENPEPGKVQLFFYLFMAKNYSKATEVFNQISSSPNLLPIAWKFDALLEKELNNFDKAIMAFEKYFSLAKTEEIQASDYFNYAECLTKAKKDSLSIIAYDNSLKLDSTQIKALQQKADAEMKLKKYPDAIKTLIKLMSKRTQPMSIDHYTIGKAYLANNQLVEADTMFSRLIRLQPTMPIGYVMEAKVKSIQDPEQKAGLAKPYYEKVIELGEAKPDRNKADLLQAYNYLATYSYNIEHDIAKTKMYYEKIIALNPADTGAAGNLEILKKMEQKKAAATKQP